MGGVLREGPVDFRTETLEVLAAWAIRARAHRTRLPPVLWEPSGRTFGSAKRYKRLAEMQVLLRGSRVDTVFPYAVPKGRTDDGYFAPLERLKLGAETELYLGLIHYDDAAGDAARLAAARRHVRVDGIATECGMARGDPTRLPALLAAHVRAVEAAV